MNTLTIRQMQVYEFVRHHIDSFGKTPTRAQIARALNFRSTKDVEQSLKNLASKKLIALDGDSHIRLLALPKDTELPLVGRLAEGQSAPQWLKGMLQALTQVPVARSHSGDWVQQSLFG
jgi:repressor LexA